MPKVSVLDQSGKEVKKLTLSDEVFGIEPNTQAMYDALKMQMASLRSGNADTKERAEVSGTGKKPYRQKGTGRARRGDNRSPIMVGGGTVFGPTPRSYTYHINKKVSRLAIRSFLSEKVKDSELSVLDKIEFKEVKTKDFIKMMNDCEFVNKTLFLVSDADDWANAYLSGRNLPNVTMLPVAKINPIDLANADRVVLTEEAVKNLEEAYA